MAKLSASELITEAKKTCNRSTPWPKLLSSEDRKTLDDLVQLLIDNPDVTISSVAKMLPSRFGIDRSVFTIRMALTKMVDDVKAKS